MFLMNWVWALISIAFVGVLWFIRHREVESRWGDLRSGVVFERPAKRYRLIRRFITPRIGVPY